MSRKCRFAYVAGLILGVASVLGTQSSFLSEPPATSILNIPVRGLRQKPPVGFSHQVHEQRQVACQRCHHDYQGQRNVWKQGQPVKKCQACHGLSPQARRLDLKNALHRQGKGCHLQLRQQGRRAGPIKC